MYSHAQLGSSIAHAAGVPDEWYAALMILICVYAAAFGLTRGLFARHE
jgi:hypothetical protein